MTKKKFITVLIILATALFVTNSSKAQNNNEVKSLGDIFNPNIDYGNDGKPLTSEIMANYYYKTCIAKKSLAFDEEEKKILCACTSAKMAETLSVEEFMLLDKNTNKARDARSKMLAYTYAPCMEYVIEKRATIDCLSSDITKDIIRGKKAICKCVANRAKQHIIRNAGNIITRATHYDPMTLNPLEHYFINNDYSAQHKIFTRKCRYDFEYNRDNRR